MKRSLINEHLLLARDVLQAFRFFLPRWAFWTPEHWRHSGPEVQGIRQARLGWDVTDFGQGRFEETGWVAFTLRNHLMTPPDQGYSERVVLLRKQQCPPLQRHLKKTKDIVNRGGAPLFVQLHEAGPDGTLEEKKRIEVHSNDIVYRLKPGAVLKLDPGDSLRVRPGLYHRYWAEEGFVLVGELGGRHDDMDDTHFFEPVLRWPRIEPDTEPLHLLCHEYPETND